MCMHTTLMHAGRLSVPLRVGQVLSIHITLLVKQIRYWSDACRCSDDPRLGQILSICTALVVI